MKGVAMLDKNGKEITVGCTVKRNADKNGHLPIPSMKVLRLLGERNIETDVRTNALLPPIYLASLCEVI